VKPRMHGKSEVMAATCGDPVSNAAAFLSANPRAVPPLLHHRLSSRAQYGDAVSFPAERLMRDCY
jgi:hypothetical protein